MPFQESTPVIVFSFHWSLKRLEQPVSLSISEVPRKSQQGGPVLKDAEGSDPRWRGCLHPEA